MEGLCSDFLFKDRLRGLLREYGEIVVMMMMVIDYDIGSIDDDYSGRYDDKDDNKDLL